MTTPKEAIRPFAACIFDDNGDITIDTSHLRTEDYMRAKSALASLQGEDAVERVARESRYRLVNYLERLPTERLLIGGDTVDIVRPQYLLASDRDEIARILATGLVPDEAAIRADNVRRLEDLLKRVLALGETGGWRRMPDQALFSSLPLAEDIKAAIRSGGVK